MLRPLMDKVDGRWQWCKQSDGNSEKVPKRNARNQNDEAQTRQAEGRGRETPKLLCRERGGQSTKDTPVWQEKQRRRERQGAKGTTEALTAEKLPNEGRT